MVEENVGVGVHDVVQSDRVNLLVVTETPATGAGANEGCVVTRVSLATVIQHRVERVPEIKGMQNCGNQRPRFDSRPAKPPTPPRLVLSGCLHDVYLGGGLE